MRNIYHHHHPESKKRKSSERIFGAIDPHGRYGNAWKTSKTISTIAILWPVKAIFEKGRCGGGGYFRFPCYWATRLESQVLWCPFWRRCSRLAQGWTCNALAMATFMPAAATAVTTEPPTANARAGLPWDFDYQGKQGQNSGPKKTMTARDVTGFYAFFSARESGNFLHILERFPN